MKRAFRTVSVGWVIPRETACEMHVAQMSQALSSLATQLTNTSVVRVVGHFQN
jgi:hypothetical protein